MATNLKAQLKALDSRRDAAEDVGRVDVVALTKNIEEQLERCLDAWRPRILTSQIFFLYVS